MRKAGEEGRGLLARDDGVMRDLKRRSNGRKDGVGLFKPGRNGRTLLPGDERNDP